MTTSAPARILRLPEVKARTGLSRTTLYLLAQANKFPASLPLGARARGWLESDITHWIEQRAATREIQSGEQNEQVTAARQAKKGRVAA